MAFILYQPNPCGRNVDDDDVTMELQDLMRNAPDERTRQKIQTILNRM